MKKFNNYKLSKELLSTYITTSHLELISIILIIAIIILILR